MELSLYSMLKEKVTNEETKNIKVYFVMKKAIEKYTFLDLYNAVNKYISIFSKINLKNKRKYVLVDNSIDSIAVFIALLECKAIPILIDKNNLQKHNKENFNLKEIYALYRKTKYDFIDTDSHYQIVHPENQMYALNKYLNVIPNINEKFYDENDDDSKFIICTSGSISGNSKLVLIKERELIEYIYNRLSYDFRYCYTSISSISGIISIVLAPLITNSSVLLDFRFDLENLIEHKVKSLVLPRDILDYLNDKNIENLDFSDIEHLYLAGEINSLEVISEIRKKIPTLKPNIFANLYGTTETFGTICTCVEDDLKNIYINQIALAKGEIIYTYDKVNIYKMIKENNSYVGRKIDINYDKYTFFECLPVSSSIVNSVQIKDNLGEIIVDGVKTGDIGTYIDNKLYVISRVNDVVNINGVNYYLTAIEKLFSKLTGLKVAAIKVPNQDKIFVAINYNLNYLSGTNFKDIIPLVKKCYELCDKLSFIPLEKPIFIESGQFPKSNSLRKTIKKELIPFIESQKKFDYYVNNYEKAFLEKIISIFKFDICKSVTIKMFNGVFIVQKSNNITFDDIISLLKKCSFIKYDEDNENFYLIIDDAILFNTYPKKYGYVRIDTILQESIKYYKRIYNEDNFIEKINEDLNRIKKKEKKYCELSLAGKKEITDNGIVFCPDKIISYNDILYSSSEEVSSKCDGLALDYIIVDRPYNFFYNKKYDYKNSDFSKYYAESYLKKKIEYFKRYLNHEYFIDNQGNCYLDGRVINKKDCFIFDKMSKLVEEASILKHEVRIYKLDKEIEFKMLDENDTIIVLKDNFSNKVKWCRIDCYLDFNSLGFLDSFNEYPNKKYQLEAIIDCLYIYSTGVPILFVSGLRYYTLNTIDRNSLINLVNQEKLKSFLNLIELVKKQPKRRVKIETEEVEIDFSKLKVVYMILDDDLYLTPTKEKYLELGYPKEVLSSVGKIQSFYGLFQEYKNSKIKKKVK